MYLFGTRNECFNAGKRNNVKKKQVRIGTRWNIISSSFLTGLAKRFFQSVSNTNHTKTKRCKQGVFGLRFCKDYRKSDCVASQRPSRTLKEPLRGAKKGFLTTCGRLFHNVSRAFLDVFPFPDNRLLTTASSSLRIRQLFLTWQHNKTPHRKGLSHRRETSVRERLIQAEPA